MPSASIAQATANNVSKQMKLLVYFARASQLQNADI